jgi:hypothetical protein
VTQIVFAYVVYREGGRQRSLNDFLSYTIGISTPAKSHHSKVIILAVHIGIMEWSVLIAP